MLKFVLLTSLWTLVLFTVLICMIEEVLIEGLFRVIMLKETSFSHIGIIFQEAKFIHSLCSLSISKSQRCNVPHSAPSVEQLLPCPAPSLITLPPASSKLAAPRCSRGPCKSVPWNRWSLCLKCLLPGESPHPTQLFIVFSVGCSVSPLGAWEGECHGFWTAGGWAQSSAPVHSKWMLERG